MYLQVCREVRNFFETASESGDFSLFDSQIALNGVYKAGQFLLITGSLRNDGIYKIATAENGVCSLEGVCEDEVWSGTVYTLRFPPDFLALCGEIQAFQEREGNSNIVSESVLGVHSYSAATDSKGGRQKWQDVFRKELAPFRRMFTEVKI